MSRKAAKTGPGAMVLVAIEQYFPDDRRILSDELACPILPLSSRFWVAVFGPLKGWLVAKTEAKVPGLWGGIMARKRYIDDTVVDSIAAGAGAVVNLGAGFDTRAFRLPALAGVPVWEVDQPENIEAKRSRLASIFGEVPAHVHLVPIDFDREDLGEVLSAHGYEPDRKSFFIWEGVTQYVTEAGIRKTLEALASSPAGSRLVFTYIPRDFIDGEALYGQEHLYRQMLVKDRIWLFGLDPESVDAFIGDYGWRVAEHLGYDELGDRYVRPTGRKLASLAIERLVLAEKL